MLTWIMFLISFVKFLLDLPGYLEQMQKIWDKIQGAPRGTRMKLAREAHAVMEQVRATTLTAEANVNFSYAPGREAFDKLLAKWQAEGK